MVDQSIVNSIKNYMLQLGVLGIHPEKVILFGSFATGKANELSDIDLIVIAPEFDGNRQIQLIKKLWKATSADNRIEPIPCGKDEWENNHSRPILEIARNEGIVFAA
ncbi:putative nucleotidyltransferase [Limihaloglobus sulfuriphilus]|uniref:Putative nucleotidyltransferase n=1 Tax=Limihaloglobus sulfuriphilus TaxID=1851148 RepID=A0A1Q2MAM1_9BACT|nr:nucleotidyltransferase domain-containing protein [Limihaloglobus sulfuriphilus]AQQ69773.1 putative nucleotidyltransferase [Limihaloglobus sulfuriphilus]